MPSAQHDLAFLDIYAFLGTPETEAWEKPNPDMILLAAEKHGIEVPLFRRLTTLVRLGEPSDTP